jgi:HK97 family phage major capsid protein
MTQNERQLKAVEANLAKHADETEAIWKKAEDEQRHSTEEERLEAEKHLKAIRQLKKDRQEILDAIEVEQDVRRTATEFGKADPVVSQAPRVTPGGDREDRMIKSIGEIFVNSPEYKALAEEYKTNGRLAEGARTGSVQMDLKGTLLEGSQATPGTGGALAAPVPQVVPGVVETLFQPLTFANLLLSGQTNSNAVRYVVEGTATSGAAGVAEAGLKPESTLGLSTRDEPVKKIATILPISEEMIEDAPAVQSYINGRLTLFVRIEEERQLLRGTSGGNEVQGILTSRNVPVYAGGTAVGNRAVQLFKAMNGLRGSAFVEPSWTVMHPSDWEAIRLLADSAGQLFGGGPFYGPYGGPQGPASASGQVNGNLDQVWGKPVYVTATIGAGTALIGSTSGAQVWRKGGISVDASNSHSDYFQRNLVALRAEERLALAVYRPAAFTEVRLA